MQWVVGLKSRVTTELRDDWNHVSGKIIDGLLSRMPPNSRDDDLVANSHLSCQVFYLP